MKARPLLILLLACAGCTAHTNPYKPVNHFTHEHAFTEAATERSRRDAQETCAQKKLVAARTGGTCSLTRCTTHYQCMTQEEAAKN